MAVRKLLLQALLLAAPFLVVVGTVLVVDPYDRFRYSTFSSTELKQKNLWQDGRTMTFSNLVWKLLEFERAPNDHLLLGDSRLAHFDDAYLEHRSGHHYYNFGIPGGNYRTLQQLFDRADSLTVLRDVVIQTSFRSMNTEGQADIFTEAALIAEDPLLHVTNRRVLAATWLNVRSKYFPNSVQYDVLAPDHWQQVLAIDSANARSFVLDSSKYAVLRHIAARCRATGASLHFVEYPTHPDVQGIYRSAGLDAVRDGYIATLRSIAPTYDLDRPGVFPEEAGLWRDPLHLTEKAQRVVIDTVWAVR